MLQLKKKDIFTEKESQYNYSILKAMTENKNIDEKEPYDKE